MGRSGDSGRLRVRYEVGVRDFTREFHDGVQAPDANFEGACFAKCVFTNACFEGANFHGANFERAVLDECELNEADFQGASLRGASLRDARLVRAVLTGADLEGADLRGADLRGADLRNAKLAGASLANAGAKSAVLDGAGLRGAKLRGSDLRDKDLATTVVSTATEMSSGKRPGSAASRAGVDAQSAEERQAASIADSTFMMTRSPSLCPECAVPFEHKHGIDGEDVCTACYLNNRKSGFTGDMHAALELLCEREICAYCGEHAVCREQIQGGEYGGTLTTPQCKECVELCRGNAHRDFSERLGFIKERLDSRYAHAAEAIEWDAVELTEFAENLRHGAALGEQARRIVRWRLEFDLPRLLGL